MNAINQLTFRTAANVAHSVMSLIQATRNTVNQEEMQSCMSPVQWYTTQEVTKGKKAPSSFPSKQIS